jgi:hypothetical protein
MRLIMLAALLAGGALEGQPAGTQILDTLYRHDGSLANGTLTITGQQLTSSGQTVVLSTITVTVVNGSLNVTLAPNDTAQPSGTSYSVRYFLTDGTRYQETWVVPTSARPVTVSQIRAAIRPTPNLQLLLSQLSTSGAVEGACIKIVNGAPAWSSPCGGGSSGGQTWAQETGTWAGTSGTWASQ